MIIVHTNLLHSPCGFRLCINHIAYSPAHRHRHRWGIIEPHYKIWTSFSDTEEAPELRPARKDLAGLIDGRVANAKRCSLQGKPLEAACHLYPMLFVRVVPCKDPDAGRYTNLCHAPGVLLALLVEVAEGRYANPGWNDRLT